MNNNYTTPSGRRDAGGLHYLISAICILIGIFLDQWTKYLAIAHLKDQPPFVIIEHVFQLSYLENRGAAFGIMQNQKVFFFISTFIILCAAAFFYSRLPVSRHFLPLRICMVCIITGAIGNFIDRIRFGYVVDFFYFELIDFPVFNIADIFVTVSAVALAVLILFYYKEEDFEQIFHHRN